MKLIGLMLARSESWVIGCSARAALKWCDDLVVIDDDSTDDTAEIARDAGAYVVTVRRTEEHWPEMHLRQKSLDIGRNRDGTHFAIIDADEVLTATDIPHVKAWFGALAAGQCLDAPMIACWKSLDEYNAGIQSTITLGFRDAPGLCWKPRGTEQYHHHARPPMGSSPQHCAAHGRGVFHLQFAAWDRFIWKHRHYLLMERLRWGYPARELNEKYHWFERITAVPRPVPSEYWAGLPREDIHLAHDSWYRAEVERILKAHSPGTFRDLDLFGMEAP